MNEITASCQRTGTHITGNGTSPMEVLGVTVVRKFKQILCKSRIFIEK